MNGAGLLRVFAVSLFVITSAGPAHAQQDWQSRVEPSLLLHWRMVERRSGPLLSTARAPSRKVILSLRNGNIPRADGVRIFSRRGDIAAAEVELSSLPVLASDPAVDYVRLDSYDRPLDDPAMLSTRAMRIGPKLGFDGSGVIVGVLDTGIDWTHRDFLGPDGTTRLAALVDLSMTPDSLEPGDLGRPGAYGGVVFLREDIEQALAGSGNIRQKDYVGHGSHVMGNAAATPASGADTINQYGGVAPGADMVMVKVNSSPTDSLFSRVNIMNGMAFIDSFAAARSQPWVANLSFGSAIGSHDGRSEYERFLAGFVDNNQPGRTVVVSAGNERQKGWHAAGEFPESEDSTVFVDFVVGNRGTSYDNIQIEIWLSENHPGVELGLITPDENVSGTFPDGYADTSYVPTSAGVFWVGNAPDGPDPQIGDRKITVQIYDAGLFDVQGAAADIRIMPGAWRLTLTGSTGSFDAYMSASRPLETKFASNVVETGTVSVPATTPELLSVGAYVARTDWTPLDPGTGSAASVLGELTPGALARFSSLGPNRKGIMKPEITAPGEWVMSTLSNYAWPDRAGPLSMYYSEERSAELFFATDSMHAASRGTSFASPVVAGICALLLQADPTLTSRQLKDLLTETASTDSMTTGAPDNFWGHGRVNTLAAFGQLIGLGRDSVGLSARFEPGDTLRADTLRYIISADLTGARQNLVSFELEVRFPPANIRLSMPDSMPAGPFKLRLDVDRSAADEGTLKVTGSSIDGIPGRLDIAEIVFMPVSEDPLDGLGVEFSIRSLNGDMEPVNLASLAEVEQAAPLVLRPSFSCPVAGDLDSDGRVNIHDLLALLRVISGSAEENPCADVDDDGNVDIYDLLELLKLL